MTDFGLRRRTMVDSQVRTADVTKFPIIDAMLNVPRELFVPAGKREAAYVGENVPIAPGRVLLEPRAIAKMLDALDIQPTELVLDIGCGLGYSAALIARLAEAVVAVEDDAARVREIEQALTEAGADNVAVAHCALVEGAPKHGPYDVITIQGAVEVMPEAILDQLKEGGRIACLFQEGRLQVCKIGYKVGGEMSWRPAFHAGAPVLPGFEAKRSFVL